MRVGLIGPLPPLRGGIAQYNQSLRQALDDAGHTVLPLSFRRLYPKLLFPGTSQFDAGSRPDETVDATLLAWDPISWLAAAFRLRRFKPDVLVIHHWHPFFAPALKRLMSWSGVKTRVVIAHNVLPHEPSRLAVRFNRGLFRRASVVFVGSTPQREELNTLAPGVESGVTPHPAYTRFFSASQDPLTEYWKAREELGVPKDRVLFVHLGLVREYKGLDVLLNALGPGFTSERDWELRIAGEFYDAVSTYTALIDKQGLRERVSVRNEFLADDDLARLVHAADAVVLPYRHATQSGMAMAALAGGAPVIATRSGSLGDVIEDGCNGLLAEPGDVESLRTVLQRFLADDPGEWRERRSAIATETRERFSWQAVVRQIEEVA